MAGCCSKPTWRQGIHLLIRLLSLFVRGTNCSFTHWHCVALCRHFFSLLVSPPSTHCTALDGSRTLRYLWVMVATRNSGKLIASQQAAQTTVTTSQKDDREDDVVLPTIPSNNAFDTDPKVGGSFRSTWASKSIRTNRTNNNADLGSDRCRRRGGRLCSCVCSGQGESTPDSCLKSFQCHMGQ
jgi:hypothetical protein